MKTITNILELIVIGFFIVTICLCLNGCMSVKHTGVPQQIKDDFGWADLSKDDKNNLMAKYGGLKAIGTGQVDKEADGAFHIDTTAKLSVLGDVVNKTIGHASGLLEKSPL